MNINHLSTIIIDHLYYGNKFIRTVNEPLTTKTNLNEQSIYIINNIRNLTKTITIKQTKPY